MKNDRIEEMRKALAHARSLTRHVSDAPRRFSIEDALEVILKNTEALEDEFFTLSNRNEHLEQVSADMCKQIDKVVSEASYLRMISDSKKAN